MAEVSMAVFGWRSSQVLHWVNSDNLLNFLSFLCPALRAMPIGAR
jgi:hypothetical protein